MKEGHTDLQRNGKRRVQGEAVNYGLVRAYQSKNLFAHGLDRPLSDLHLEQSHVTAGKT